MQGWALTWRRNPRTGQGAYWRSGRASGGTGCPLAPLPVDVEVFVLRAVFDQVERWSGRIQAAWPATVEGITAFLDEERRRCRVVVVEHFGEEQARLGAGSGTGFSFMLSRSPGIDVVRTLRELGWTRREGRQGVTGRPDPMVRRLSGGTPAATAQVIINARVACVPEVLRQAVERAIASLGQDGRVLSIRAFSPGRSVPVHRIRGS